MTRSGAAKTGAAGLVILQLLILAALVLAPTGFWWIRTVPLLIVAAVLNVVGFAIAVWGVVGLGPALTASPIPKARAALVTSGLYGVVRNPIYSGLLIFGAGFVIYGASWWHAATWVALAVLFAAKARWEERMLGAAHPEFAAYAQRVGRFIPGVGRLRQASSRGSHE